MMTDRSRGVIAGFTLGFLLAIPLAGCGKKKPPPPAPTATPAPPAPKGRLVFTVRENLFVSDADGSNLGQITFKTRAWFPSASPSGKLILFWSPEKEGVNALNLVSLDGSGLNRILAPEIDPLRGPIRGHFLGNAASFSPDETTAVYAAGNRIWRTDLHGRNQLTLLALGDQVTTACPLLSPDGNSLYYVSDQDRPGAGEFWIWKYDLVTHQGTKVLGLEGHAAGTLRLNKDGDSLAFTLSREGKANVGVIKLPGGPHTMLTDDGRSYGTAFSPDGTKILYVKDVQGKMAEFHVIPANGHGLTASIPGLSGFSPAWSPAPGPSDEEAMLEYLLRRKGKTEAPVSVVPPATAAPSAIPAVTPSATK